MDVALESKQRGFLEMLAAFISPPPPREQRHFDAILRLAVFFEDLSGETEVMLHVPAENDADTLESAAQRQYTLTGVWLTDYCIRWRNIQVV